MGKETNDFIKELRKGRLAAQQRLLTDYGPAVFRLIVRMVGQQEDAEEIYQDVFVKALTKIHTFAPEKASLQTWLGRIAYNEAVNHLRHSRLDIVFMDDDDLSTDFEYEPDDTGSDEQTVMLLEQAMQLLPAADQTLLSLFYYENMSMKEIAYITGSIPSTIGSRLSRIRKKLYQTIKQFSDK